ncbi:hypothetical protein F2Q69_00021988 [Brassica cretica]|uniref:Uncharacterized protein n=1 Tax=Brassica cretica TaxID=69181 RepID=A0A8S9QJH2_BRACR|nr:hypothetical protein F2Q69_00021988 [Brassica cretica]
MTLWSYHSPWAGRKGSDSKGHSTRRVQRRSHVDDWRSHSPVPYSLGNQNDQGRPRELRIVLSDHPEGKNPSFIAITEKASSPAHRGAGGRRDGQCLTCRRRRDAKP